MATNTGFKRHQDDRPDLDRFLREALERQAAEKEAERREQASTWTWRDAGHD